MVSFKTLTFIATVITTVSSLNVLFLNGIASPSHHLWNRVLIRSLAEKGHNITMVSVDNDKNPQPNIHYIFLEATYETIYGGQDGIDLFEMADQSPLIAVTGIYEWCELCCDGILKSKGLDTILNYPDDFKFDIVINDFTCGPCLLPLIHKFNYPPVVAVTAFSNPPYSNHLTGGSKFPAFVPHYIIDYPQIMNYPQRLFNALLYAVDDITRQYIAIPKMERKIRDRFKFKNFPSLDELEKKTAIVLVNSDNAVDYPEPLQPNMIQVGGLQIMKPKELTKELLNFVESGKLGTILMSLGTNIKSNMLNNQTLTNILKTFDQLPQYNFIWKFESEIDKLPVVPSKNVFIAKFLPQNDVLAHPKVKAFVTHSGLLGTQEAMWYGKPMIGIPFFCDQIRTIAKSIRLGIAVDLDFRTFTVEDFKKAILTVVEVPSYSENAKRISKLFQDKPQKPLDTALWWIDYVMRNPSAPQFDPPSLKLGWFAANSYDIILTVIVGIHFVIFITFKIAKIIKNLFAKSESKKLKSS